MRKFVFILLFVAVALSCQDFAEELPITDENNTLETRSPDWRKFERSVTCADGN